MAQDMASLRKVCGQSAYTYMYTQEVLRRVEAQIGKSRPEAERKLRRIRQELHEVAYKKHGTKLEPLILVRVSSERLTFLLRLRC